MRILIAPDKFKGVLSAREVAETIAAGLRDVLPKVQIDLVPMADGGEGTTEIICEGAGGSWCKSLAHDPLGREIEVKYAWIDHGRVAVMEMSEAAGLRRVDRTAYDPDFGSTFGVGEMILDAAGRGATEIIIGLGGSATNDGGTGMAQCLGYKFDYEPGSESPAKLDRLNRSSSSSGAVEPARGRVSAFVRLSGIQWPEELALPKITAATDVRNPLLGKNGATRIFGPQKGVKPDRMEAFEAGLRRLAEVTARGLERDLRNEPGAGAAGGLGFGLAVFCGAKLCSGFDVVAAAVKLEDRMRAADVIITGEGRLDGQTLQGKTPAGVAAMARRLGRPVFAIAGATQADAEVSALFHGIYAVKKPGVTTEEAMARAGELVRERARELARELEKSGG
jgi:glycerate kinase